MAFLNASPPPDCGLTTIPRASEQGKLHRSLQRDLACTKRSTCPLAFWGPSPSVTGEYRQRNILVHLPRGPHPISSSQSTADELSWLSTQLSPTTSLASINYRLGLQDAQTEPTTFPVAIHDVATAFAYVTSSTSRFNEGQNDPPKVCLMGSHIGGALATMLAFTEPNDIHALAAVEPMVDWVGLEEIVEQLRAVEDTPRKRMRHKSNLRFGVDDRSVVAAVDDLIKLRAQLFPTPSSYFDPFAGPMLFLRAPGRDTPLGNTVGDQMVKDLGLDETDGGYGGDNLSRSMGDESNSASTSSATSPHVANATFVSDIITSATTSPQTPPRRRKVLQRWPSVGRPESTLLPHVKVFVEALRDQPDTESPTIDARLGHSALMRAQGSELVELMRRACFYGREKGFAEERVQLNDHTAQPAEEASSDPQSTSSTTSSMQGSAVKWAEDMFQSK
ncbi:hypothetical protein LTR10_015236 [Elasticomyces elasticus]|uniref:BD-FAE-like domain-containing protein n=1 Tax=Exophiala sideris TaxID=1016849 RepID=A0ABR0JEG8_9EURO|nr:hypothetical protein LTR10_015236 [Elasticomyces elasticus]KAK5032711.1 hypothetical protein LTS07_004121 [Exophiala sideris]KAK5062235.1 hypothetical protein LTR69_004593 [Exophiala sideris]